jgi:hypothetical protein
MIIRFLAAAALCVVASAASAKTVFWDRGGLILAREAEINKIIARGDAVKIVGLCLSSCTMYLSMPNVCVSRGAVLMFHGPYVPNKVLPADQYIFAVNWMAEFYPPPIADWFRMIGHDGDFWTTGQVLIDLGVTDCG